MVNLSLKISPHTSETCTYEKSGYSLTTEMIKKIAGVTKSKDCENHCKNETKCRYFQFSDQVNGQFEN